MAKYLANPPGGRACAVASAQRWARRYTDKAVTASSHGVVPISFVGVRRSMKDETDDCSYAYPGMDAKGVGEGGRWPVG